MGDLTEMRAAAEARLVQAERESSVLNRIAVFGDDLDSLGVSFEVLRLDAAQIEISVVIGGLGDPAVHQACEPAPVAPSHECEAVVRKIVTGRWSDAEVSRTHKMLDDGATSGQIAKALGRAPAPVSTKVAKMRAQRGDSKWRAALDGEATAPAPPPAAPAKRKLVPGKERPKKALANKAHEAKPEAAKPAPAVKAKVEKPAASVPFAKRAGVASLPTRAAPDTPDVPANAARVERPYAEQAIISHLDAVGYADGWNAERDFELVEDICRGHNLAVVATELQVGFAAAQARWRQLNTHIGDTDHQARLVRILKERADA